MRSTDRANSFLFGMYLLDSHFGNRWFPRERAADLERELNGVSKCLDPTALLEITGKLVAIEVAFSNASQPLLGAMFRRGWAHMLLFELEASRAAANAPDISPFLDLLGLTPQERLEVTEIMEEGGSVLYEYWDRWETLVERSVRTKGYAFICHAAEDKPAVRELQTRLHEYGFRTWLDEDDILPGQDWDVAVRAALKGAQVVLVLLSHVSIGKRGYVQREMQVALDAIAEIPEGQLFIIPVVLDDSRIPSRLARYQAVWLRREGAFEKLIMSLNYQMRGIPAGER